MLSDSRLRPSVSRWRWTREDVAANLHISNRTLRRILQTIVGLVPIKAGLDAATAEESRIRAEIIDGPAVRAAELTIADAILAYASRAGGIHALDALRLANFNDLIGHWPLNSADGAWSAWIERRASGLAPATVARSRAILRAALAYGAAHHRVATPVIRQVALPRGANDRIAYLTHEEADRLVAAYNEAARRVALVLRYQGLRTQEALRPDSRAIDWRRQTILVTATDQIGTARTRAHARGPCDASQGPRDAAFALAPQGPTVTRTGVHLDPRQTLRRHARSRGNPLARAHITACSKVAIRGFRVHDWHHWASHLVMAGVDLRTLMELGGWTSLRMVERYAQVSTQHMAEAIAKVERFTFAGAAHRPRRRGSAAGIRASERKTS